MEREPMTGSRLERTSLHLSHRHRRARQEDRSLQFASSDPSKLASGVKSLETCFVANHHNCSIASKQLLEAVNKATYQLSQDDSSKNGATVPGRQLSFHSRSVRAQNNPFAKGTNHLRSKSLRVSKTRSFPTPRTFEFSPKQEANLINEVNLESDDLTRPDLVQTVSPLSFEPNFQLNCSKSSQTTRILYDDHISRNRRELGRRQNVRYYIALLGLVIAVVNSYAQATFCIAIVEMVFPPDYRPEDAATITGKFIPSEANSSMFEVPNNSCKIEYKYRDYYDSWRFKSIRNVTAHPENQSNATNSSLGQLETVPIDLNNRFNWDASRQGLLLGAFAIGTAPLQVFGGRMAEIYGSKWVLWICCMGTAVTNFAIPTLAHMSFWLLLADRILMGVAQAGMESGLMCLLADWLAPQEAGFFISMLLFAMCIGFFLGSLCTSFLLALGYGWPSTYYWASGLNLLVGIIWMVHASSWPKDSKLLTQNELEYIDHSQNNFRRANEGKSYPNGDAANETEFPMVQAGDNQHLTPNSHAPWRRILTTRSVWAFIVCKVSVRWAADVLGIELPTYLANVLHLSIKLNGILNSISSALFAIFSLLAGYAINEVVKAQERARKSSSSLTLSRISKTSLRKLFQSLASFGTAIFLYLMTRYDCDIVFSMSMMLVLSCCLVMGTGGELQIPYDMTPRYAGTLHGIACTMSVSGWLAPPLIGLILGDEPSSRERWRLVWYLTASINVIGGLAFVAFADSRPQDFDSIPTDEQPNPPRSAKSAQPASGTVRST